jgi:hypothetical protein
MNAIQSPIQLLATTNSAGESIRDHSRRASAVKVERSPRAIPLRRAASHIMEQRFTQGPIKVNQENGSHLDDWFDALGKLFPTTAFAVDDEVDLFPHWKAR